MVLVPGIVPASTSTPIPKTLCPLANALKAPVPLEPKPVEPAPGAVPVVVPVLKLSAESNRNDDE